MRDATDGYAAGLNRYIRQLQDREHPGRHADCRDAEWLHEVSEDDIYRRYFRLAVIASSGVLSNEITNAQPPLLSLPNLQSAESQVKSAFASGEVRREALPWPFNGEELPAGSNMYGIGAEDAQRTLRTRLCALHVLDGSDGLDGTGFTFEQLQDITVSSQIYSERLARQTVLDELCSGAGVQEACAVLESWDGTGSPDARGAHVWREFWRFALSANNLWNTPFSVSDPVNTPRGLNTGDPAVISALGDAIERIDNAGVELDAQLGSLQISGVSTDPDGNPIPVPGGEQFEGAFTIAGSSTLSAAGYPVTFGNSYIQAVTWEDGRVEAKGFLTYSQSTDPASPHFSDFTREYAERRWHRFPFTPDDIAAQAISELRLTQ